MEDAGRSTHLGNEIYTEQLCEGELFLHESAFHRDSFFPPFFEEKKSRYEWTNVATMSRGISARNNTARTNQRYPLLCTRQPSKKLRNIQRILGKREERERGTAEKTGKKKLRRPRINEI